MISSPPRPIVYALAASVLLAACDDRGPLDTPAEELDLSCSIPVADVFRGARRGVIPALSNPPAELWGDRDTEYVTLQDRVVGLIFEGQPIAVPLNILWWHEIVNFDGASSAIAVTHCPLTGSSLVFDRAAAAGASFDVSGLLYENNLMMFDEVGDAESLWPQMARGARCGPLDGTPLPMVHSIEMTLGGWLDLYPASTVVTSRTGHGRVYTEYPYANQDDDTKDYDYIDNEFTLFPVGPGMDGRRPPKERALGIPDGSGGAVFPYGELSELGAVGAVNGETSDGPYTVFWDASRVAAAAYVPIAGGQSLTFQRQGSSVFDDQTGSEWSLDGRAVAGALTGETLEPIADSFVAFWFAWPVFYPDLELWEHP